MKSLYIPASMVEVFNASTKTIQQWGKPSSLTGILSPVDVGFYIHANVVSHVLLGHSICESTPNALVIDEKIGTEEYDKDLHPETVRTWRRLASSRPVAETATVPAVLHMTGDAVYFTLVPVEKDTDYMEAIISALRNVLPLEKIAAMPMFLCYLKSRRQRLTNSAY